MHEQNNVQNILKTSSEDIINDRVKSVQLKNPLTLCINSNI